MVCCRHCHAAFASLRGLGIHLARAHGVGELVRRAQERQARIPCPMCVRTFQQPRHLAIHLAVAHGITSDHPKTLANRHSRGDVPMPSLPLYPDGPVALLEAVIWLAHHDARRNDQQAQAWLRDVRSLRRV